MGEHRTNGAPENHFIPFGSLVESHASTVFDLLRFHQFGKTVLRGILLEYVWYGEREFWNEVLVVADLEQLDKVDASEFHAERLSAKEVISPKFVKMFFPSRRWKSKIFCSKNRCTSTHSMQ